MASISGAMTRMKGMPSSYMPKVAPHSPMAKTMIGMKPRPSRPVFRIRVWIPALIAPVAMMAVIAPADSMITKDRSAPSIAPRMNTVHSCRNPCGLAGTGWNEPGTTIRRSRPMTMTALPLELPARDQVGEDREAHAHQEDDGQRVDAAHEVEEALAGVAHSEVLVEDPGLHLRQQPLQGLDRGLGPTPVELGEEGARLLFPESRRPGPRPPAGRRGSRPRTLARSR